MSILIVGLGAGFLSGIFGVGGGILIVPGLVFFAKMDQRRAHGTSLAAVLPISLASLVTYWSHDHVDWHVALWLAIGAVGGAILGTKLLKTARHDVLSYGFATVLIVSALRLYWTTSADGAPTSASWRRLLSSSSASPRERSRVCSVSAVA